MDIENLLPLTPAVFYTLMALAEGDRHGYAIMQQARVLSLGRFRMGPGTLYSTIQRLLELGLIEEVSQPEPSLLPDQYPGQGAAANEPGRHAVRRTRGPRAEACTGELTCTLPSK
jgi:hypothetical protein